MKRNLLVSVFLVFASVLSACGSNATPTAPAGPAPLDKAGLVSALQAADDKVEAGDPITQEFFSVEGQTLKLNGSDLQVFEYQNPEAMEAEAAKVAPDGGSIGTSMVNWIDTPHFYKAGRILVLYVGNDQKVLDLLKQVLGPQFAGG